MLSFLKRKAKPSNTNVAPVPQEKTSAESTAPSEGVSNGKTIAESTASHEDFSIVINVMGWGGNEQWVYPNMYPKTPMPRPSDVIVGPLPVNNCAVPVGWYFEGITNDKEIVLGFPKNADAYLALKYEYGAVYGTEYIAIKFNRNSRTLEATAWGYNRKHLGGKWQVSVLMDIVQIFGDCVYQLPTGDPGTDRRLCNYDFVHKKIFGNNLWTRVAYGINYNEAEDVFDLLLGYVASTIYDANKAYIANALQLRADGKYDEDKESIAKLYALIEETDALTQSCAVKQYLGVQISKADWEKAQSLYDIYISLTNALNALGNMYYELNWLAHLCDLNLNLCDLVEIINTVGLSYEKLRGLFDLLRS
ncbi:MAG: hypothetical protein IJH12_03075 [Clostridia bacterium]|nr:hypothetical protein [Clostridia bacterium]